jgi:hypothetical protein
VDAFTARTGESCVGYTIREERGRFAGRSLHLRRECRQGGREGDQTWCQQQWPVMDMFWGDCCGKIVDPDGYSWMVGTHKAGPSTKEGEDAGTDEAAGHRHCNRSLRPAGGQAFSASAGNSSAQVALDYAYSSGAAWASPRSCGRTSRGKFRGAL